MPKRPFARNSWLILCCVQLLASALCGCKETGDPVSSQQHHTRLQVQLTGAPVADETAEVYINGGASTTISADAPTISDVDPGNYDITVITKLIPTTFTLNTTVKEGETKTINIPCKPATVTVVTDAALALDGITQILLSIGTAQTTVVPGEETVLVANARLGALLVARDQNGKRITTVTQDLLYDMKFRWTVSH
jgi:hypothetical protein